MSRVSHTQAVHSVARVLHMNTQQDLAAEVRAELGKRRVKAAQVQRAIGISSSAWSNYFVQCNRDVPMSVVIGVAGFLGIPASELLARAESAEPAPNLTEHVARQVSPAAQAGIAEGLRQVKARSAKRKRGN